MFKALLIIALMAGIGGFIGTVTNFIAIRMLFRPHKTLYIGKLRLPFTPGLIPKRRHELANKIAQVIMNDLLTEETIANKLNDPHLRRELIKSGQQFFETKMAEKITVRKWLSKLGFSKTDELSYFLQRELESKIKAYLKEKREQKIVDIMPNKFFKFIEIKLPHLAETLVTQLQIFAKSEEGKKQIEQLILNFFTEHRKLGNMMKIFISIPHLTEKVSKEAEIFLSNPDTKKITEQIIQNEWQQFGDKKLEKVLSQSKAEQITAQISHEIIHMLQEKYFLNKNIQSFFEPYKTTIVHKWIPYGISQTLDFLAQNHSHILAKLDFVALIKHKIATFSLPEIEKIILDLSGKELKMITYLGGALGAFIGVIQGILAIFIN